MSEQKPLIALGYKMRSGKDSLASALSRFYDIPLDRFAAPLKAGTAAMGFGDGEVVKNREILQNMAMSVVTRSPMHFVDMLAARNPDMRATGLVIPDLRMPAEFAWVRQRGFLVVKLEVAPETQVFRGAEPDRMGHLSETALDIIPGDSWDLVLSEAWSVADWVKLIDQQVRLRRMRGAA